MFFQCKSHYLTRYQFAVSVKEGVASALQMHEAGGTVASTCMEWPPVSLRGLSKGTPAVQGVFCRTAPVTARADAFPFKPCQSRRQAEAVLLWKIVQVGAGSVSALVIQGSQGCSLRPSAWSSVRRHCLSACPNAWKCTRKCQRV